MPVPHVRPPQTTVKCSCRTSGSPKRRSNAPAARQPASNDGREFVPHASPPQTTVENPRRTHDTRTARHAMVRSLRSKPPTRRPVLHHKLSPLGIYKTRCVRGSDPGRAGGDNAIGWRGHAGLRPRHRSKLYGPSDNLVAPVFHFTAFTICHTQNLAARIPWLVPDMTIFPSAWRAMPPAPPTAASAIPSESNVLSKLPLEFNRTSAN